MGEMAIDALNSGNWYSDNDAEDEKGGAAPDNRGGPIPRGDYQLQNSIHDHGQWNGGNRCLVATFLGRGGCPGSFPQAELRTRRRAISRIAARSPLTSRITSKEALLPWTFE